jgi:hypothetical protein
MVFVSFYRDVWSRHMAQPRMHLTKIVGDVPSVQSAKPTISGGRAPDADIRQALPQAAINLAGDAGRSRSWPRHAQSSQDAAPPQTLQRGTHRFSTLPPAPHPVP